MDSYEKKYKEANDKIAARFGINVAKEIFTDLYESEDEKIRKEIISFIQDHIDEINLQVSGDYDTRDKEDIALQEWCKKAIAWLENIPYTIDHAKRDGFHLGYKAGLEKQGEQKPSIRERYDRIKNSEWFKKTHEGMSISDDEKVDDVNYCSDCTNDKGCINCEGGNMHEVKKKEPEGALNELCLSRWRSQEPTTITSTWLIMRYRNRWIV